MRRTRPLLVGLVAVLLGALLGGWPTAAGAQDDVRLGIREVDATDPAQVRVTFGYSGSRADVAGVTIRQDGELVSLTRPAVPLDDEQRLGVVLLIDSSLSMEENGLIAQVLGAAREFVTGKAATDQVAVVTFDNRVQVLQEFTSDTQLLLAAIDRIALDLETHLYDGIVRAASLFDGMSVQPNVVVFSDGEDTGSAASLDQARGAMHNLGGALFAMGVPNDGFARLQDLAAGTGGTSALAADAAGVGSLFDGVQESLRKQYVATFAARTEGGPAHLQMTIGDQQANAEIVVGSSQSGAATLEPKVVAEPRGPEFLRSRTGLLVVIGAVLLGVALLVWSLGNTFLGGDSSLKQALQPYEQGYYVAPEADGGPDRSLTSNAILQRAVEVTGQFAERQGLLTKLEALLERANIPLRPNELIFFYALGVVIVLLLALLVMAPLIALLVTLVAALLPVGVLRFLAGRRKRQFESQLPDTLQLLASTLRAGYSLMQGVEAVSQEVAEPMGRELRRVVTEARLGRPLEESLQSVADRMGSPDFEWAVMAIRIQREVGGNLSELLLTVAETMTERERLRRDVKALTAEGRMSAIVLGIMPPALGFFIYTLNPEYMDPLFDTTLGQLLLVGSVLLAGFGFWWMKKTIEVEI